MEIEIFINPGNASKEQIKAFLNALSDLHIAHGGLGLTFETMGDGTMVSVPRIRDKLGDDPQYEEHIWGYCATCKREVDMQIHICMSNRKHSKKEPKKDALGTTDAIPVRPITDENS